MIVGLLDHWPEAFLERRLRFSTRIGETKTTATKNNVRYRSQKN